MTKLLRFSCAFLIFSSSLLPAETKSLEDWWKGKGAGGDLFGVRPTLEDRGLDFSGHWGSIFASVVAGGLQKRGTFVEQVRFELDVDFAKLTGWEVLEGLTGYASTRWRDGTLINPFVGTTSLFSPVDYRSGHGWRIMPIFLTYTTPELFGIKELLTVSGGWQNPYDDLFAWLPASKSGFRNNGIVANKGISANDDVDWSSSYAAWGGYLKIKPTDWFYAMAGLYMAIPGGSDTGNHGLDFEGSPGNNGLWFLNEIGLTPKLGASKLPGKYFFGWYYWGVDTPSLNGTLHDGVFGFYWAAQQMVWREPSPPVVEETRVDAKSFKSPVTEAKPKLSDQGLTLFAWFHYAPSYRGLIPTRDDDTVGLAFAYGNFGEFNQDIQAAANDPVQTYEAALECYYRIQLNKFLLVQPFIQYIIRPGGAGLVDNATVLGMYFRVAF
jgi:porin